jgi:hypothetical protein
VGLQGFRGAYFGLTTVIPMAFEYTSAIGRSLGSGNVKLARRIGDSNFNEYEPGAMSYIVVMSIVMR